MPIIVTSKSKQHETKNVEQINDDSEDSAFSVEEYNQNERVDDDESSVQTTTHQSNMEDTDREGKTEEYLGESFTSEKSENVIEENNISDINGGDGTSLFPEGSSSSSSSPGSLEILGEHEMEEDSMIIGSSDATNDLHSHPNNDNTREKEFQNESKTTNIPLEETELTHRILKPTEKELANS
eukprot:scaffold43970_cov43-Attheya_sp.AAC.1